ncbi:MAG: hypothetical protein EAZ95_13800 [Bacteroidetes bacterium]|nr:MAG: hypothetical protein EAZ95_13800 [Bacteroidota bacterium]
MKDKHNKKKNETKSIKVRDSIKDFDIQINSFGEIVTNYDVDKINEFLNQNIQDKKIPPSPTQMPTEGEA